MMEEIGKQIIIGKVIIYLVLLYLLTFKNYKHEKRRKENFYSK